MKRFGLISFISICVYFFLSSVIVDFAVAKGPILDDNPSNIRYALVYYDYRDYGDTHLSVIGGPDAKSGPYFSFDIGIQKVDLIEDFNRVISVIAKHMETDTEFSLLHDADVSFMYAAEEPVHAWGLLLQPKDWMFEGTWQFILTYMGTDKKEHQQIFNKQYGGLAFPVKPSHISTTKSGDFYIISWSGIHSWS